MLQIRVPGVILKSPGSNILSLSLRYVKILLDRFSRNKELIWLVGLYMPMISHFLFRIFISKYIAPASVFSLCEFSCLDTNL